MLTSQVNPKMVVMMTTEELEAIVNKAAQTAVIEAFEKCRNSFEEKSNEQEERYLTRFEVADMLHVNLSTLYRWNLDGTLTNVKIGKKVFYLASEVAQYIDLQKIKRLGV